MSVYRALLVFSALNLWAFSTLAEEVHVAVASNFTAPMEQIATAFEHETDHRLLLSFGSSGKFYAQIRNGAPFDVFFSADQAKPEALERDGWVVEDSRFTYALGALVLWSRQPGLVDSNGEVLRDQAFNKLALANPRLAPYGVAAVEVLDSLGLTESTRHAWVRGENIAQTYQFVHTGNADIGFVALSQVMADGSQSVTEQTRKRGSGWRVPSELHSPIRQDAVLLTRGKDSEGARALLRFMRSDRARGIIERYGYQVPDREDH